MTGLALRRRAFRLGAIAALALAGVLAAGPRPAIAQQLAVTVDDITVVGDEVTVKVQVPPDFGDRTLTARDFRVYENDRPVEAAIWAAADRPTEVVLLIDTSGSMDGEPLEAARQAARQFVERLPDTADVALVSFGSTTELVATIDAGRSEVDGALAGLQAGGETALYDAASLVSEVFSGDPDVRRIAVLLSDGGDTVSGASSAEAALALAATGAEVRAVALQSSEGDRDALAALVRPAGGAVVQAAELGDLAAVYAGIADELLGHYTLTYRTEQTGTISLGIVVTRGDLTAVGTAAYDGPPPVTGTTSAQAPGSTVAGSAGSPPAVSMPAPEVRIAPEPGLLSQPWVMWGGIGALVVGLLVGTLLLARVGRERRPAVADVAPVVAGGAKRMLSFLSRGAEAAAEGVLQSRKASGLDASLDRAGITLRPAEFVVMSVAVGVSAVALGLMLAGPVGGVILGVLALAAPRVALHFMTSRRRNAFTEQLEGTLQMMASSLRAGYGLLQAIRTAGEESPSPTAEEFDRVVVENRLGRPLVQSLAAMADRMDDDDLRWVVEAIDIQQEVGGNLAEVLDTVNTTIRDRNQIRRQIRALSAEGKMSAIILLALPFGIGGFIATITPDYIAELTTSSLGIVMIVAGLVLMGLGALWIRKIVKVEF
jgi:tight adherence protein B